MISAIYFNIIGNVYVILQIYPIKHPSEVLFSFQDMKRFSISYQELVTEFFRCDRDLNRLRSFIGTSFPNLPDNYLDKILQEIRKRFLAQLNSRWKTVQRSKSRFYKKYSTWLQGIFEVEFEDASSISTRPSNTNLVGRPKKSFDECCDRAKRMKVSELRAAYSQQMIDAASRKIQNQKNGFDANTALALIMDAQLSRRQYETIRVATKKIGFDIFPSYQNIQKSKQDCYPENINITESSATNNLQKLLDHTAKRLFETIDKENMVDVNELTLLTKWGCDGSSGQSEYKQKFTQNKEISDEYMFMTSMVPLRLISSYENNVIIWNNDRPSSTRYCRVIQFQYTKETTEKIKSEKQRMDDEIAQLRETEIEKFEITFKINHQMIFTMIDGKVAQAVTDTPSISSCFICGCKPSEMNNLAKINERSNKEEALKLGMSPLHARIKFMECILHIAYNSSFKKWSTTSETRIQKEETKKRIQEAFYNKLGLRVDIVKQGSGSSNDGNTSRRFFADPKITAEITGVDEELIRRFSIILQTINCGGEINSEKFGSYANKTAENIQ